MNSDRPSGYLPRDRAWHPPALAPDYKSSRLRSPRQPLLILPTTLSEESGPVFGHDVIGPRDDDLIHNYATDGHSGISGSPSKYICGIRRCAKASPNSEK